MRARERFNEYSDVRILQGVGKLPASSQLLELRGGVSVSKGDEIAHIMQFYPEFEAFIEGIDNRVRYPMTIHHDPAGETGRAWLESIVRAA